jgi:hypothetical protein
MTPEPAVSVDSSRLPRIDTPEAPVLRVPVTGIDSPPQARPLVRPPTDSLTDSEGAGVDELASAIVDCSHEVVAAVVHDWPAGTPVRKLS